MPSSHRPKVLLIGSAPFGGLRDNPATIVIERIAARSNNEADIVGAVLPVSYAELPRRISALVASHRPTIALGIGLFVGAASVRVETTALNRADFDVADNEGVFIRNRPLRDHGPAALIASYHAEEIATALRMAGVPARVSHHAGTHLCNLTLYCLLEATAKLPEPPAAGFVHLPLLPEQAARMIGEAASAEHATVQFAVDPPSMSIELQTSAVEQIVAHLLAELTGRRGNHRERAVSAGGTAP